MIDGNQDELIKQVKSGVTTAWLFKIVPVICTTLPQLCLSLEMVFSE